MKYTFLVITVLVYSSTIGYSQNMLLDRGQSGYSLYGTYQTTENVSGPSVGFKLSYNGVLDFGANYGISSNKGSTNSVVKRSAVIGSYHFVKQTETLPISVGLSVGYSKFTYSSDDLEFLEWGMYGSQAEFGSYIYHHFMYSQSLKLIPYTGFYIDKSKITIIDKDRISISADAEENYFGVGCALLINTTIPNKIIIEPSIYVYDEFNQFNLIIGMLILQ